MPTFVDDLESEPPPRDETRDFAKCPVCDKLHFGLLVRKLSRPVITAVSLPDNVTVLLPIEHWAICPDRNEPILTVSAEDVENVRRSAENPVTTPRLAAS